MLGSERPNLSGVSRISGSSLPTSRPSSESGPSLSGPASRDATPADYIAMQDILEELVDSVESLSEEYSCAAEELKKKGLRFSISWERRIKTVLESVAASTQQRGRKPSKTL